MRVINNICLVVPDLNKGGMERVMSELANYFSLKENTVVEIILLTNHSDIFYKIQNNISIHTASFSFNNKIRTISTLRTLFYLRRTIKKIQPEAILSFGETYNSFVLLSCLFLKVNIFVSDRSKPDKKWGWTHETLRRILYPLATGIISQTNYSKLFLQKEIGHKNIKVIPNPVRPIDKTSAIDKKNVILNVGRLIRSKRLDLLINIFSKCDNKDWELWIVGEDESGEKEKLIQIASELNVSDKVKFWGKQEKVDAFYRQAEIFAFTSESEGMPNVLLEAMSAGMACISFDCVAGPKDIISDNIDGYLVDLYDNEMYVTKLNKLLNNSELRARFSKGAYIKAGEYSIQSIGEAFYNFLLS